MYSPKLPSVNSEAVKNVLLAADQHAAQLMILLDENEQVYRQLGVNYHRIRLSVRRGGHVPANAARRLRDVFEISTLEERKKFFAPYGRLLAIADELRKLNFNTPLPRLEQHVTHLVNEACAIGETHVANIEDMERTCMALQPHNTAYGPMWYSVAEIPKFGHIPEEQKLLCQWIATLPETQRLMDSGVSIHQVACDALHGFEDGFENDGACRGNLGNGANIES